MGFFDFFRRKESDSELQRLVEIARNSKYSPEPQVELALAYLAKIETPPNWSQDYAKKSVNAFKKAIKLAQKYDPAQATTIRSRFAKTGYDVAVAYRGYFDSQSELKWLGSGIWMLEKVSAEAGHTDYDARINALLGDCWTQIAVFHEEKLTSNESEGEKRLKPLIQAAERAMTYLDQEARSEIDIGVAHAQLQVGHRYVMRAEKSAVLKSDGRLINTNDRQHKGYAKQAISLLKDGRKRLKPYSTTANYAELMADSNALIAGSYIILYNLTWAHSKMDKAIKILQEGVRVVPQEVDLWHSLGSAYELLIDEVIEDTNKRMRDNDRKSRMFVDNIGSTITSGIMNAGTKAMANSKIDNLKRKAVESYQRARELAPDRY